MRECIQSKIAKGVIDQKNGQALLDLYDGFLKEEGDLYKAQEKLLKRLEHETFVRKKQAARNIAAYNRFMAAGAADKKSFEHGVESLVWSDGSGRMNFENLSETIRQTALRQMRSGLKKFTPTLLGGKGKDFDMNAGDFVRELFGNATGNADMAAMAKAWSEVAEAQRLRFNDAGGDIPFLKEWRLPQKHDAVEIRRAGGEEWKNFVRDLLDWDKIVDFDTGLKMDPIKRETFLRDVYATLSTDGLNKIDPDLIGAGGKAVANRHKEHRSLIFKDADSWLAYNKRFGGNNPINAVLSHIDTMSREIAQMEIFGANPKRTKALIDNAIALRDGERAGRLMGRFDNIWREAFGFDNVGRWLRLGKVGSFTRGWLSACQLGSAIVSSFTDPTNAALVAAFSEHSPMAFGRVIKNYAKLILSEKDRRTAETLGFVADGISRVIKEEYSRSFDFSLGQRLNRAVMKASLLESWTNIGQMAHQMELSAALARVIDENKVDSALMKLMNRYGIGENELAKIAKDGITDVDGARYVNLAAMTERDRDVGEKLQNLFLTERNDAIVNTSLKTAAILHQGRATGTFLGELTRCLFQYKAFPITYLISHYNRFMREENFAVKAAYVPAVVGLSTMMGALSLQAKQWINGKESRPMDTKEFWIAAMAQGGGTGIVGDLFFSDVNRVGGGVVSTFAGPSVGLFEDLIKLSFGNIQEAAKGEDTHFGSEVVQALGRYVPGSNLWYARLAFERLFLDQLKYLADPKASRYFYERERKTRRDYGQTYWWRPGKLKPE